MLIRIKFYITMQNSGLNIKKMAMCTAFFMALYFFIPPSISFGAENKITNMSLQKARVIFVYNLIKYVSWPKESLNGDYFEIGVFGGNSAQKEFWNSLNDTTVHSKKIHVHISSDINDLLGSHLIYIQNNDPKEIHRAMAEIGDAHILTVGEIDSFITHFHGMVALSVVENRITFRVNLKKARMAGLDISSLLLKLAAKVYQ